MKTKVHLKFLSVANSENKSALKSLVKPQLGSVKVRQNFYQNFHHMGDRNLKILSPTDKIALISKWWNGYCNPASRIMARCGVWVSNPVVWLRDEYNPILHMISFVLQSIFFSVQWGTNPDKGGGETEGTAFLFRRQDQVGPKQVESRAGCS